MLIIHIKQDHLITAILFGCLLVLGSWVPFADVITFAGGDELHGDIVREDKDSLTVRLVTGGEIIVGREFIQKILREPPEVFYLRKGDWYLARGDYNRALQEYRRADEKRPGQQSVTAKIAEANRLQSQQACSTMIQKADSLVSEGRYRAAINQLNEAAKSCEQGEMTQDIRRKLALAQSQLAFHYFNHCFMELALEELIKAEEYDSYCAHVYYVLGRIYHSQSRFQTAQREYLRALELDPTMKNAQEHLLRLQKDMQRFNITRPRGA